MSFIGNARRIEFERAFMSRNFKYFNDTRFINLSKISQIVQDFGIEH